MKKHINIFTDTDGEQVVVFTYMELNQDIIEMIRENRLKEYFDTLEETVDYTFQKLKIDYSIVEAKYFKV